MTVVPGSVRVVEHHSPAAGRRFQFEVLDTQGEPLNLWGGVDTRAGVDRVLALFRPEVAIIRVLCNQEACKEAREQKVGRRP